MLHASDSSDWNVALIMIGSSRKILIILINSIIHCLCVWWEGAGGTQPSRVTDDVCSKLVELNCPIKSSITIILFKLSKCGQAFWLQPSQSHAFHWLILSYHQIQYSLHIDIVTWWLYFNRTVARAGCCCLVWWWWERCCCCWSWCWSLRCSASTSRRFRTTFVFPRMKSFTHGRISQWGWRHGRGLVTQRCHHGQGGSSQSWVLLQIMGRFNYMYWGLWLGGCGRVGSAQPMVGLLWPVVTTGTCANHSLVVLGKQSNYTWW